MSETCEHKFVVPEPLDDPICRSCGMLEKDYLRAEVERLKAENNRLATSKCNQCVAWNRVGQLEDEVERLKGEVKRLTEWQAVLKTLHAAIDAADLDVSTCRKCGRPLVCLPDGMPMCKSCAEKQEGGR